MRRLRWEAAPAAVHEAIEDRYGTVLKAETVARGLTPGVAVKVTAEDAVRFVKAIPVDHPAAALYLRELAVANRLPTSVAAPRLAWGGQIAGWLVMDFELVDGHPAQLSPGSPDLRGVQRLISGLSRALTPFPWAQAPAVSANIEALNEKAARLLDSLRPTDLSELALYDRLLADFAAVADQVNGGTLINYDLSASNILVSGEGVIAVDWAFACRAAPWVEAAMLTPRLIEAGHTPAQAERFMADAGLPLPKGAAVTGLAVMWTMFREYKARYGPVSVRPSRARAAQAGRAWVLHRASLTQREAAPGPQPS